MLANNDRVMMYGVQTFKKQGAKLVPETPRVATSANAAIRMADELARTKAGVMAFSRSGDNETGEFDDPVILALHGAVPSVDAF